MENKRTETPLRRALEEYIDAGWSRLHMPGHKGAPIEPFGTLAAYDLTEVEGTDSLFEDDGPLKELEEIFTQLYGTRSSVISAGGSTLCIQAMLRLVAREGGKVIAGRNIHAAAVNAMALLGLEPAWVYPRRDAEERLIGRIAYGTANCRDLRALASAIACLPEIREQAALFGQAMLRELTGNIDLLEDVRALVELLPAEQREVVMMRYFSGLSFKEIAEQTDVSINTALGRMRYALINLRKLIDEKQLILN